VNSQRSRRRCRHAVALTAGLIATQVILPLPESAAWQESALLSGRDIALQSGFGSLSGRVADALTGEPIASVDVIMSGVSLGRSLVDVTRRTAEPSTYTAVSDKQGRFAVRSVPPASYSLVLRAAGYLDGGHGQFWPSGPSQPLHVDGLGNQAVEIDLPMWKAAALAGTVTDEVGEPIVRARITLIKVGLQSEEAVFVSTALTDDHGRYRIARIAPGKYIVGSVQSHETLLRSARGGNGPAQWVQRPLNLSIAATESKGQTETYGTGFYPGVDDIGEATVIALRPGETREAIDLRLVPKPGVKIAGVLEGPNGPVPNVYLHLVPSGPAPGEVPLVLERARTKTDTHGAFVILGVLAGEYDLITDRPATAVQEAQTSFTDREGTERIGGVVTRRPPLENSGPTFGRVHVSVGSTDVTRVTTLLKPVSRLSGVCRFDGKRIQPTPAEFRRMYVLVQRLGVTSSLKTTTVQN
jgi:hypothetical protein